MKLWIHNDLTLHSPHTTLIGSRIIVVSGNPDHLVQKIKWKEKKLWILSWIQIIGKTLKGAQKIKRNFTEYSACCIQNIDFEWSLLHSGKIADILQEQHSNLYKMILLQNHKYMQKCYQSWLYFFSLYYGDILPLSASVRK
jgi:hypothetical protein